MDSRVSSGLLVVALGLLTGCSPLLKWNRDEAEMALVDGPRQPATELAQAVDPETQALRSGNDEDRPPEPEQLVELDDSPEPLHANPVRSESAEFLDQLRGGEQLTPEQQRTVEKVMESSPEAARFLASRTADPAEKNLARIHERNMPPPADDPQAGVDLLRHGTTMPPIQMNSYAPPSDPDAAYPPQARLGAPSAPSRSLVPPASPRTGAPAEQQLAQVHYGNPTGASPPATPGYDGRPGPAGPLQSSAPPATANPYVQDQQHLQQLRQAYQGAAGMAYEDPRHAPGTVQNPYVNQVPAPGGTAAYPHTSQGGYPAANDPRMVINRHVQQAAQPTGQIAPVGYNAEYTNDLSPAEGALAPLPAIDAAPAEPAPIEPLEPGTWRQQLERAIASLENDINTAQAGQQPPAEESASGAEPTRLTPLRKQELADLDAQLRLLYLAGGMREAAVSPVELYDARQQAFWKYAMNGLSVYLDREKQPVDDRRLRLALRDLRQAVAELAVGSSLDVRNLAFCTKVDSFGSYQEFPEFRFAAGEEVLLYVEVENFTSEQKKGGYETSLLGSYRVFDARKTRVADHTFIEETETCRNQRRDYFITYRMWIPKDIAPGTYTLQLTLEDLKGNKSGQASLRFEVE